MLSLQPCSWLGIRMQLGSTPCDVCTPDRPPSFSEVAQLAWKQVSLNPPPSANVVNLCRLALLSVASHLNKVLVRDTDECLHFEISLQAWQTQTKHRDTSRLGKLCTLVEERARCALDFSARSTSISILSN